MKVLIASSVVPSIRGGGTLIVDWLEEMLLRRGHEVDVFKFPFVSNSRQLLDQMTGIRLMEIAEHGDRLIALRPPAYLLRHPKKILWFIHHHRQIYDFWGTSYQDLPNNEIGYAYREAIVTSDHRAFSEASRIYTNSRIVARRLSRFNGIEGEVLYPPILDPERFRCLSYGDFIFYPSTVTPYKRQHLAIEALAYTKTPVKLVIAGLPADTRYGGALEKLIATRDLSSRVTLRLEWISEQEKIDLLADCLAVLYVPHDEDSYGYPSLEAHHSQKAVVTAQDSGGTLELIEHEDNGLVVPSEPQDLAEAMDRLWENRHLARRMGERGRERVDELQIDWDNVLERLLE